MEEREMYLQLLAFATGPATEIVQHCFEVKVLCVQNKDIETFLDDINNKHTLFHEYIPTIPCCKCPTLSLAAVHKRGCLNRSQFVQLYDDNGVSTPSHEKRFLTKGFTQHCLCKVSAKSSVRVDSLDISLLYNIIQHCCTSKPLNPTWLKDIKDIRNCVSHVGDGKIVKLEFDNHWKTLEIATLGLAGQIGSTCEKTYKRAICQLKKSTVEELIKMTKESNDTIKEMLNDFEGIKPFQTILDTLRIHQKDQNERLDKLETILGELIENLKNLTTRVQIKESNQSSTRKSDGDISLECEVDSPVLDERQATHQLTNSKSSSNETLFEIQSVENKCLILKLASHRKIFEKEESLHYAIISLIKQIVKAGEIYTYYTSTMEMKLTITSPITDEERKVVRLMLSKYGNIEEKNISFDLQHEAAAARQYETLSSFERITMCDSCRTTTAMKLCTMCVEFLCENCAGSHSRFGSEGHPLIFI